MISLILMSMLFRPVAVPVPGASMAILVGQENDPTWHQVMQDLKMNPVAVLAPGYDTIGYGIQSDGEVVSVFRFNLLLEEATRDYRDEGVTPEGQDEMTFPFMWVSHQGTPNRGDAVEWALSELAFRGMFPAEDLSGSWSEWISAARKNEGPYDSREVVRTLLELGFENLTDRVEP